MISKFKKHPTTSNALALALFTLISGVGIFVFHEPWRDEMHIWLMASESTSLSELHHHFRAEEHPKLWFYLMYALSGISSSLLIKQLFTWGISIVAVFYLLFKSPFTTLQKWLLVFGYYALFEFTLISRVYSLELAALALLMSSLSSDRFRWSTAVALAILAQTTLLGVILSGAVWLYIITEQKPWKKDLPQHAIVVFAVVIALWQILLGTFNWGHLDTISWSELPIDIHWASEKLSTFYRGFAPLLNPHEFHFWNTHVVDLIDWPYRAVVHVLLSGLLMIGILYSFWDEKKLIALYLVGAVPMLVLFTFFWHGCTRHHGHFFLLYLVCYVLLILKQKETPFSRYFLTGILMLQLPGGFYAYDQDRQHVFSQSQQVVDWVRENGATYDRYAGTFDYTMTPLSYYSGHKYYVPESKTEVSFITWSESMFFHSDSEAFAQLIDDVVKAPDSASFGNRVLLIKSMPIYGTSLEYQGQPIFDLLEQHHNRLQVGDWVLSWLHSTDRALVKEEGYYIFELSRRTR